MIHRLAPQPELGGLDLRGRVCLVTGATSGHGRAVARWLARLGGELVLLGRDRNRCQEVQQEIAEETGRSPEVVVCDLSSRADIDRAAAGWLARGRPLHVLVNNAGLVSLPRRTSTDGVELTFAVNYLAGYQLTLRLLGRMRRNAPARVVNVSSDTHRIASLEVDDLARPRRYGLMRAYARSKLAIVQFTQELARRLAGSGVTVNAVDPGPVQSRIGQNNPGIAADLLAVVMRYAFPEADWAARTAVWLAAAPELAEVSGAYFKFGSRRQARPGSAPTTASRLWELSARLTGADLPAEEEIAPPGRTTTRTPPRRKP